MSASVNQPRSRADAKVMSRYPLLQRFVPKLKKEEAVIGGIGWTNFDLWAVGHRPQNFYMLGSMGLAIPIAHGVAIAQPQRKVFALEGDGSLLMELSVLATVGARAPKNLAIIVMDNGGYQITGGQVAASEVGTDLVDVARACGIKQSSWAADEAHFDELVDRALTEDGPWLIGCHIDNTKPVATTERDPALIRDRFMRGLGVKK
jgi:thiamine pyrophosphate-dependent acetolactate synthase large subunit-like protein